MKEENAELLVRGAKRLGVNLSKEQIEKFDLFLCQLIIWNKKINLTAIVEEREIIIKHFLDSLSCLVIDKVKNCSSLIDIGSGAGFPGIPLAIAKERSYIALLESSEKKSKYLARILALLGVYGEVLKGRAEELAHGPDREAYEVAVARAVSSLPILCEYAIPFVKKGGSFIAQKSEGVNKELEPAKKAAVILGGGGPEIVHFELPFTSAKRYLVVFEKKNATSRKYPRRTGLPKKRPLGINK